MIPRFYDGARVAFIGDSITAENNLLSRVIDAYKKMRPDNNIRFYNIGVAGGTAEFAVTSFDREVLPIMPTHAVVSFGINDSHREYLAHPKSESRLKILIDAFEVYKVKLAELIDRLLALGTEVILCTPMPYDEYSDSNQQPLCGGYALMLGYSEYVRGLAKQKGVHLYDQHTVISRIMECDTVISPDRIHPTDHGYYVMTREFLSQQGMDLSEESPIPEYLHEWHACVAKLRKIQASECMIVQNYFAPTDEKMAFMRKKVENEDWGQPVFESFIRDYVANKPDEERLFALEKELYGALMKK